MQKKESFVKIILHRFGVRRHSFAFYITILKYKVGSKYFVSGLCLDSYFSGTGTHTGTGTGFIFVSGLCLDSYFSGTGTHTGTGTGFIFVSGLCLDSYFSGTGTHTGTGTGFIFVSGLCLDSYFSGTGFGRALFSNKLIHKIIWTSTRIIFGYF